MAAWQPQPGPLQELAGYLKDSLATDVNVRKNSAQMLQQASYGSPDINNYLCYILVHPTPTPGLSEQEYRFVRCAAAQLIKNNVKEHIPSAVSPSSITYLKSHLLLGLRDSDAGIRSFTGNVVAEVVRKGGVMAWTDLLGQLFAMAEGTDNGGESSQAIQEGAIAALKKVCQDSKKQLDKEYDGQRPLNFMIPKFLQFTQHPTSSKIRGDALEIINLFLPMRSQAVLAHVDSLISTLFKNGSDSDSAVRREVCRALVHLVDIRPDKIAPIMSGVVDYLVDQQKNDDDPELALDAAEFWLTVGEHDQLRDHLGPYLPKVVPVLLKSMVYSDEDIEGLGGEGYDADEEDRAEDIKPTFAKVKQRLPNGGSVEVAEEDKAKRNGEAGDLSDGEIDEYDSDFDDDSLGSEDPEDRWNLRKCSAAALDVLATVFHQPVLEIILPYLKENLRHPEWPFREAAVLALGAVADGCLQGVTLHLPELVPYLIALLNDQEPLIRQITCWTLGRYSRWAAHLEDPAARKTYFEPMMEGILMKMLDGNKRVQEAAASAFANLEEQSKEMLTPYIEPIVRQFVIAMRRYKDRNMFILYDCVQTLAEHVGAALSEERHVNVLMPALIERWKRVKDDSRELFPLLECLSYVATALGRTFAPFAGPIFVRCIHIIHHNLELQMAYNRNPALDEPDKDFLVTSLDLLSAIIQALDSASSELVGGANLNFFQLLTLCMADSSNDVRQSSYALLGDCAIYVYPQLKQFLPTVMDLLIGQLKIEGVTAHDVETSYSVINNACWSCGEIALQEGIGMSPYVEQLYVHLLNIIRSPNVPESVTENAAIALGRLGLGSCDELSQHLGSFAHPFLEALEKVAETDEKDSALRGFCMVVGRKPEAMESCLLSFFKAIARYKEPSLELAHLFSETIKGYKSFIADFDAFMSQVPPPDQEVLQGYLR